MKDIYCNKRDNPNASEEHGGNPCTHCVNTWDQCPENKELEYTDYAVYADWSDMHE